MRDLSIYAGTPRRTGRPERPKATILDVDGSLCDVSTALPALFAPTGKDFDAFHTASRQCPPYPRAIDYARHKFRTGHVLLVVTGRVQQWRELTADWLDQHLGVPYDGPFMREQGDSRPADVFKREIHAHLSARYDIRSAIDDDQRVIDLWRSLGLKVTVGEGRKHWDNPEFSNDTKETQ